MIASRRPGHPATASILVRLVRIARALRRIATILVAQVRLAAVPAPADNPLEIDFASLPRPNRRRDLRAAMDRRTRSEPDIQP